MYKKLLLLGVLGAPLVLTGCLTSMNEDEMQARRDPGQIFEIESQSMDLSNSYIAYTESMQSTTVSSKIGGKISQLLVEEGAKVKQGQILAILDVAESQINYNASSNILSALQGSYGDSQEMFDAQIRAMEEKVDQAKVALELSELSDGENLATAGRKIEQSKLASEAKVLELEHSIALLEQQESQLYSNAKNALSNAKILLDDVGAFTDQLLGLTEVNRTKNDSFETYLGVKDADQKNALKAMWNDLRAEYAKLDLEDLSWGTDLTDVEKQAVYLRLKATENFLDQVVVMMDEMQILLDNSIISVNFSQQMIDGYKQQISQFEVNLEKVLLTVEGSFMLGVKGTIQSIDTFNTQSTMQIDLLTKQKDLVAQQYEVDKESLVQSNKLAQQQYNEALAGLDALRKQKDAQMSQILSQIEQVKGQKAMAGQNIDNANIYAPYDGTITKKYAEVGQVVGPGVPVWDIANLSEIKLVINVPESEASYLSLGQTGMAAFDSLDEECEVSISKIAPTADFMTKKRKVEFVAPTCSKNVTVGTYAKIYMSWAVSDMIRVAHDFIEYQYGNAFVYVLSGDTMNRVAIEVDQCEDIFCGVSGDLQIGDVLVKK